MGEVQTIAAPVPETDGELAARLRAYAVTIGPTMGVTVRFTDAGLMRRVAAGLEGHVALRATIEAQQAVMTAQGRELLRQRWWCAAFAALLVIGALYDLAGRA
jgi:hypothetical protein